MDLCDKYNLVEAVFWILCGLGVVWSGVWGDVKYRLVFGLGAVLLILFGVSDWVEMGTGAWWRPWWLLVWKGGCLAGFWVLIVWYRKLKGEGFNGDGLIGGKKGGKVYGTISNLISKRRKMLKIIIICHLEHRRKLNLQLKLSDYRILE